MRLSSGARRKGGCNLTKRRLRVFDPRVRVKAETGVRVSTPTLAMLDGVVSWLTQEFWTHRELRPPDWNGKLTRDEALRYVLTLFGQAYGCPMHTDPREEPCSESD
jgi:hypothetical protein